MTLDQLQLIDIIVKTGSFSAAAKQLNRAQSAVSHGIKNLEEEWGVEIFDRSSYRAKLTKAGESILSKVRVVLHNAEALERHSKSVSTSQEPLISISLNNLFPTVMFTPLLVRFKKEFPDTQLKISVDHLNRPVEKLSAGLVDLAISMGRPEFSDLDKRSVYSVELIAVAERSYFGSKTPKKADLMDSTQIVVSDHSEQNKDKKGGIVEGASQWSVADLSTKHDMILKGLGFGYLPTYVISRDLDSGKLKEISCMQRVKVPMNIQKRSNDSMGPAKTFLWENA